MASVLLIDDDREILQNTAELLQLADYRVYKATTGKHGLELANQHNPDLILCDVMVPDLDGFGVLRAINNNSRLRGTPFVFVSSRSEIEDFRHGMDLGADDYLFKPYCGERLLSVISTRIGRAQLLKEVVEHATSMTLLCTNSEISLHSISGFLEKFTLKQVRKKDLLFLEGDRSEHIYYVSSGKIKTLKANEAGKVYISNIYTNGDFFGFNTLCGCTSHTESAEALETSQVGYISKSVFLEVLEMYPVLASKFIQCLSNELYATKDALVKLAYDSARKRVAEAVLFLARKYGDEPATQFPMNRNDLSSISGISPESVSRNITNFRDENLITVENGSIRIKDRKKLEALKN